MTPPATPLATPRLEWRVATVVQMRDETPRARTLILDVPDWPGHRAGQHVDVRLTAEDGYQAERSYSIASPPEEANIALTIERLEDGEVSTYLFDVLRPGDGLELRGPIGGHFVWERSLDGPLLLVAGGSGIVPLMAMLRHHALGDEAARTRVPVRLLYSARTLGEVIYREELQTLGAQPEVQVIFTLTRETPAGWNGLRRRIDAPMLAQVGFPAADAPNVFVCGPTALVESAATFLVELGHDPLRIRTERFGATG